MTGASRAHRLSMMIAARVHRIRKRLRRGLRPAHTPTRADLMLARRLEQTLERELGLDAVRNLHFYARGGRVTIYGILHHAIDRDLLSGLVLQVPGVRSVNPQIQIVDMARPSDDLPRGSGTEAELRGASRDDREDPE
jgi:hypothetical protein